MSESRQAEEERIRQRIELIGHSEMLFRQALRDKAQEICYALVSSPDRGNPLVEKLLNQAEELREGLHEWTWGT